MYSRFSFFLYFSLRVKIRENVKLFFYNLQLKIYIYDLSLFSSIILIIKSIFRQIANYKFFYIQFEVPQTYQQSYR